MRVRECCDWQKGLRCETCDELSKPKSHHVTKLRKATEFNQQVCVDTFEQDVRDMKTHFLNIVDEATGYQMCIPLWKGMQAKHVRNAYRKHWKRWAGPPVRLFLWSLSMGCHWMARFVTLLLRTLLGKMG